VTLRARWVTLRARWVTLRARWVTLIVCWVTLASLRRGSSSSTRTATALNRSEPTRTRAAQAARLGPVERVAVEAKQEATSNNNNSSSSSATRNKAAARVRLLQQPHYVDRPHPHPRWKPARGVLRSFCFAHTTQAAGGATTRGRVEEEGAAASGDSSSSSSSRSSRSSRVGSASMRLRHVAHPRYALCLAPDGPRV
jgi:hypothetical protein